MKKQLLSLLLLPMVINIIQIQSMGSLPIVPPLQPLPPFQLLPNINHRLVVGMGYIPILFLINQAKEIFLSLVLEWLVLPWEFHLYVFL